MTHLQSCDERPITETGTSAGLLIVNADDWGRDVETTERTLKCIERGSVSAVSAMLFMQDSERAAEIASSRGIDAGLHLNFTTPFSQHSCPTALMERQCQLASYLCRRRLNRLLFSLPLASAFRYVCEAQFDEFCRLYGRQPERVDGHHHMHLCANVLFANLLPHGVIARRNFSFRQGEKSAFNRLYRRLVDRRIARRHVVTDFLFSLSPCQPLSRVERILGVARSAAVEVETHPVNRQEYELLMSDDFTRLTRETPVLSFAQLHQRGTLLRQNFYANC